MTQDELFKKIFGLSIEDMATLTKAEKDYEKLLEDEREEVIRYASAHGWKSKRAEEGATLRAIINTLKAKTK